ncbi:acetyl-coenzyme A transporter 1-like protein, partial [Leptotrombidium deliense]
MEDLIERARKDSVVLTADEIPKSLTTTEKRRGLKGDYGNLCLLLLLYILQGMPVGLLHVIPMILSSNKVSYEKQAIFSFAAYPSIFKVLWAPIVDSKYSTKF